MLMNLSPIDPWVFTNCLYLWNAVFGTDSLRHLKAKFLNKQHGLVAQLDTRPPERRSGGEYLTPDQKIKNNVKIFQKYTT